MSKSDLQQFPLVTLFAAMTAAAAMLGSLYRPIFVEGGFWNPMTVLLSAIGLVFIGFSIRSGIHQPSGKDWKLERVTDNRSVVFAEYVPNPFAPDATHPSDSLWD